MSDNALYAVRYVVKGLVTIAAFASATILCLTGAPIGFTICAGLTSLLCVCAWM